MDFVVHSAVLAVYVVERSRAERHMVERCVEDALVGLVRRLNLDLRKLAPPCGVGRCADLIEVPCRNLCGEVLRCALCTDAGDAGLDQDGFVRLRLEVQDALEVLALQVVCTRWCCYLLIVRVEDDALRLFRYLHGEVGMAILSPGRRSVSTGKCVRGGLA